MTTQARGEKTAIIILAVLLLVSIGFNFSLYQKPSQNDQLDFFKDYVVVVNDYHVGMEMFGLGDANLDTGNWYSSTEDYYYEDAIYYYDGSKEQLIEAKQYFIHAQTKLNKIKNNVPNEFYGEEINNRLEQIDISLSLTNQYVLLNNHMSKQLYEVNYGSETEATRYFNMYNDLVLESNKNLQKLSDVSQKIDLAWDQDWYPLFEGI